MIKITSMTKFYPMGDSVVHALDGVNVKIERGEFVSITGASGSGKSTIMHLIGCLDRATSGEYLLDGQRIDKLSDRRLATIRNEYIGFVFQTFNLINRASALENVALPMIYARRGSTRKAAMAAMGRVGLAARAHHRPSELSGGERQRVAIARALVNNPPLILADEPTGNLDSRTGEQILELFHELHSAGVTIVLVTHEMVVAAQAQRVIRMRDGKVIEDRQVDSAFRDELLESRMKEVPKTAKPKPDRGTVQ
jgi:putative ABC transport system ATP-binding protein